MWAKIALVYNAYSNSKKNRSVIDILLAKEQNMGGEKTTGPDGAVAMSSANGLLGTGFASQDRLQPRAGF